MCNCNAISVLRNIQAVVLQVQLTSQLGRNKENNGDNHTSSITHITAQENEGINMSIDVETDIRINIPSF